jgi:hypothetical protein
MLGEVQIVTLRLAILVCRETIALYSTRMENFSFKIHHRNLELSFSLEVQ